MQVSKAFLFAAAGAMALMAAGPASAQENRVAEVVVTAAPYAVSLDSATTSVNIVKREDIERAPPAGLGDMLNGLPGVRSTAFSPGASRPVIRGLAGPRVLVLTNGVGEIDASALSPDHQVATDPSEAERIEVLRGPSALAYGGSAIGGVVNIIDDRITDDRVEGIEGRVAGSLSSVDDGRSASAAVKAGAGDWVVQLDGVTRRTSDYETPVGTVVNSFTRLDAVGAGLSWVGDSANAGVSLKRTRSRYGVVAESDVTIELEQTRFDVRGGLDLGGGPFERVKFAGGVADYEHVELEGPAVGTRFLSSGVEGRVELVQPDRDGWQGAVGFQALKRDFDAIGEEALIPATEIAEAGAFVLQRLDRDGWGVEGGLRVDRRSLDSLAGQRDFTNVSGSVGVFVRPATGWFLALSASRVSRAPTEEELFSDGPHLATGQFQLGAPGLDQEVSASLDATIHYSDDRLSVDGHLFSVRYDGFIDLTAVGGIDGDSGLPVFRFVQTGAAFKGAEAEASLKLTDRFSLEATADYVRGDTDLGPPARIPPWSVTVRGVYEAERWGGRLEVRRVGEQDRTAAFETPTEGYTLVNASLEYRPTASLKLFLDGRNLTDEEAREHASFLKDIAPQPGRSWRIGLGLTF